VLASGFDLRGGFFHMLFNRTVENFNRPFTFHRRFDSRPVVMWRENCSSAALTADDFTVGIRCLPKQRIFTYLEVS